MYWSFCTLVFPGWSIQLMGRSPGIIQGNTWCLSVATYLLYCCDALLLYCAGHGNFQSGYCHYISVYRVFIHWWTITHLRYCYCHWFWWCVSDLPTLPIIFHYLFFFNFLMLLWWWIFIWDHSCNYRLGIIIILGFIIVLFVSVSIFILWLIIWIISLNGLVKLIMFLVNYFGVILPSKSDSDFFLDVASQCVELIDNFIRHWYFGPAMKINASSSI